MSHVKILVRRSLLKPWLGGFTVACTVILVVFVLMLSQGRPGQEGSRLDPATAAEMGGGREDGDASQAQNTSESERTTAPTQTSWELLKGLNLTGRWTGDFDGLAKRRYIRALVVYSKTMYFLDGARERGLTYELLKEFENVINQKLKTGNLRIHVVFIPVNRDDLIPGLVEGRGDIAAANLTVTPERLTKVDFSESVLTGVNELVVTGPSAPSITRIEDLAGKDVHVRASSSYHESLQQLNRSFRERGLSQITIVPVDEYLESEDILEMVNAGLVPITVVDSHIADVWKHVYRDIRVHTGLVVRTGGSIAWAVRKGSPRLRRVINDYVATHGKGTSFGNTLWARYIGNVDRIKNNTTTEEMRKYRSTIDFFKRYSARYDFDYLMVTAQAYQESRLDQTMRSPAGAIGVMQVMPSTAADPSVNIKDIQRVENNVHAGVKYLRLMTDRYYRDGSIDSVNRTLFAFAAYNAGPGRVAGLREKARQMRLNPNVWFRNVEVAAAREIGRETVQYVSNIYKYYLAYKQIQARELRERTAGSGS